MSKVVLMMSFIGVSLLLTFGVLSPGSPIMWMAASSASYTILRIVLLVVLASLLTTNPPRNKLLRIIVGGISIGVAAGTLILTYNNDMQILDTLVILQVCVSAGLVTLEKDLLAEGVSPRLNQTYSVTR